jgi:aspartate kinase
LHGIAYTQEVTPRLHDLVQSHGERLAAPLVAAALRQAGVAAVALDGETARIRSRGPFGNALPDLDGLRREAAPALQRLTDAGQVPVVTGYYGVDADGQATLFGRGGSDYVAALVAYAVKAECLELWKDVAGFMTADPRAVPGARLLPRIGYDEAAELANFGAKVLHPRTVEPVQDAGIPIHIRPVADPTGPGTAVVADPGAADALVRSVATTTGLAVLRLNGPGMAYTPGVARRVFTPLAEAGVNVINMATSQASFALLLDEADLARAQQALDGLRGGTVQSFQSMAGRSLVCVVGRGLGEVPGSAARILQAVAAAGVNVEMISLGASDIAIDFVVRQESAARAVRAIHDTFLAG